MRGFLTAALVGGLAAGIMLGFAFFAIGTAQSQQLQALYPTYSCTGKLKNGSVALGKADVIIICIPEAR